MNKEWKEVKLENVTTILGDGLHGTPAYDEVGDYYFINGNNLRDGSIVIDDKTRRVSAFEYKKHKKNLNDRTILVSINGTLGNVALYHGEKVVLGKSACYFNVKEDTNKQFVRYVITSDLFQTYIHNLATGSTIKNVSLKLMRNFSFRLPPPKLQKEIATILGALDDRITLLRETNATLEAIAQALFKSWFVDFDPVHAKAQGTKPEGMDEQTAALFPDRFVESELGMVPLGWEVGTLGNVSTVKGGFAYKGESFCDKGFPVIKIKNIVGDGTVNLIDVQYVSSEIAEKTKRFALQDGDIVIAMTGATIGKTGIIVTNEFIPYLNQRVAKFEENSKGQNNKWFVFVAFQNLFISDQIVNSASGSAQPNISTTGIESVRLVIPKDTKLLSVYNELVSPLFNSWISNHKQTQTLATLRDTLLPRLISGQLRLPDVEEMVG
jgi:type I restriction enzyme S subunit